MTKAAEGGKKPFRKGRRVKRMGDIARAIDHRLTLNERLISTLRLRDGVLAGAGQHAPLNPISGIQLQALNALSLRLTQLETGSQDPRWMTFLQIKAQGHRLRGGCKGTWVEFWYLGKTPDAVETDADNTEERPASQQRLRLQSRHVNVFNAEDVVGYEPYVAPSVGPIEAPVNRAIQAALLALPSDAALADVLKQRVGSLLPNPEQLSPAAVELRLLIASTQLFDYMGEMVGEEPPPRLTDIDAVAALLREDKHEIACATRDAHAAVTALIAQGQQFLLTADKPAVDPRWPAFEAVLRDAAAAYAIESAVIDSALTTLRSGFAEIMDQAARNGFTAEAVNSMLSRSLIEDMVGGDVVRRRQWTAFEAAVHAHGDAYYGASRLSAALRAQGQAFEGILAKGQEEGWAPERVTVATRELIYGPLGRRPISPDFVGSWLMAAESQLAASQAPVLAVSAVSLQVVAQAHQAEPEPRVSINDLDLDDGFIAPSAVVLPVSAELCLLPSGFGATGVLLDDADCDENDMGF